MHRQFMLVPFACAVLALVTTPASGAEPDEERFDEFELDEEVELVPTKSDSEFE